MTWPTTPVSTTSMDAGTDTPPRADILDMAQKLNAMIADGAPAYPGDVSAIGDTGIWTPQLRFGAASTGITYSEQYGRYALVGDLVFATVRIALTSKGSATGAASIAGLPHAFAGTPPALIFGEFSSMSATSSGRSYACYQIGSSSLLGVCTYQHDGSASNPLAVTNTSFTNTSVIHLNFWYLKT